MTSNNNNLVLIRRAAALTLSQRQTSHDSNDTTTPMTSPPSSPMTPTAAALASGHFQRRWRDENNLRQGRPNIKAFSNFVRFDMARQRMFRPKFHAFADQQFTRQRRAVVFLPVVFLFLLMLLYIVIIRPSTTFQHARQFQQHSLLIRQLSFPAFTKRSTLLFPPKLDDEAQAHAKTMDYGGLYVYVFEEDGVSRAIYRDYKLEEGGSESILPQRNRANRDDDVQNYYAFDDDHARNEYIVNYPGGNNHEPPGRHCRRTKWHKYVFPTCNLVHELAIESTESRPTYLSYGAYRDVFTVDHHYANITDTLVLKQYRQDLYVSYDSYEYVRMDALVSERLSASPRIADIYAHCGLGIAAEFFRHGDAESVIIPHTKHHRNKNYTSSSSSDLPSIPQNNLTATEKLHIALDMAETIAELHGFPDGVIVHNDIQPSQFLYASYGGGGRRHRLKLNDFNRAEIMLWDEGAQEYCRYRSGYGRGNYRSPEEYLNNPLNEKIDVWSFGNNLYGLLTGRYIYYDLKNDDEAKREVRHGNQPPIDPVYKTRSFAEAKLVELIYRCWEYYADDRADIFEMVHSLRQAIAENDRLLQRQNLQYGSTY